MLVVEFPGNQQQGAVLVDVVAVEVRAHAVVAHYPKGKPGVIAEHVGVAGWRIPASLPVAPRVVPSFIIKAKAG
jgi:hypothetical protein